MLHRAMTVLFETLHSTLPLSSTFDRLMAVGWEDIGGVVLAMGAVVCMAVVGAIRSR